MRTDGAPSGVAVATAIASGARTPESPASRNQAANWRSGSGSASSSRGGLANSSTRGRLKHETAYDPAMPLEPGLTREDEFTVEGRLLTDVGGTLRQPVLSTPGMISMMERNAAILAGDQLPEGKGTVGFEICV